MLTIRKEYTDVDQWYAWRRPFDVVIDRYVWRCDIRLTFWLHCVYRTKWRCK